MNWIRYSIGNTRALNTMPMSIGAPQVHASGVTAAVVVAVTDQTPLGAGGILQTQRVIGRGI